MGSIIGLVVSALLIFMCLAIILYDEYGEAIKRKVAEYLDKIGSVQDDGEWL